MVPADLLSQSGNRQCSLSELGKELQGKTEVTPEDMQELRGTGMQGHRGMQREGVSSMGSTPWGLGWAIGPLGMIHPVLSPLVYLCLLPSSQATSAQV